METAANGPAATLGQRLYIAWGRAKLSTKEAANGVGLRKDLIEAVEAEEPVTEDEASKTRISSPRSAAEVPDQASYWRKRSAPAVRMNRMLLACRYPMTPPLEVRNIRPATPGSATAAS
jgi:hypothetical protein